MNSYAVRKVTDLTVHFIHFSFLIGQLEGVHGIELLVYGFGGSASGSTSLNECLF